MRSHFLRAASGGSGGGNYTDGVYYPMFGVKLGAAQQDISSAPLNDTRAEQPMQRALSFDTNNTTALDGTETTSAILSIMDTSMYTCNPDFGGSGNYISGIKLEHYNTSGSLLNYGEFLFNGSTFNIYDHACNVAPSYFATASGGGTYTHPTQMGTITSASLDGVNVTPGSGIALENMVIVNCSSYTTASTNNTVSSWANDSGDYCFLGISDTGRNSSGDDSLDTSFATTKGLAFGISDSDGVAPCDPVGSNYVRQAPRVIGLGIGRRNSGYKKFMTQIGNNETRQVILVILPAVIFSSWKI